MPDLVNALDEIRRIAHTNDIVRISQRMVALHGDASAALRFFLTDDTMSYGLPFFLANRLQEDQELEFIATYRKDLGLGPPIGARKDYPIVKRPWPLTDAESVLRSHLKHGPRNTDGNEKEGVTGKLTEKDAKLISSAKFQVMIIDPDSKA
jgi:hypothetical protein